MGERLRIEPGSSDDKRARLLWQQAIAQKKAVDQLGNRLWRMRKKLPDRAFSLIRKGRRHIITILNRPPEMFNTKAVPGVTSGSVIISPKESSSTLQLTYQVFGNGHASRVEFVLAVGQIDDTRTSNFVTISRQGEGFSLFIDPSGQPLYCKIPDEKRLLIVNPDQVLTTLETGFQQFPPAINALSHWFKDNYEEKPKLPRTKSRPVARLV